MAIPSDGTLCTWSMILEARSKERAGDLAGGGGEKEAKECAVHYEIWVKTVFPIMPHTCDG